MAPPNPAGSAEWPLRNRIPACRLGGAADAAAWRLVGGDRTDPVALVAHYGPRRPASTPLVSVRGEAPARRVAGSQMGIAEATATADSAQRMLHHHPCHTPRFECPAVRIDQALISRLVEYRARAAGKRVSSTVPAENPDSQDCLPCATWVMVPSAVDRGAADPNAPTRTVAPCDDEDERTRDSNDLAANTVTNADAAASSEVPAETAPARGPGRPRVPAPLQYRDPDRYEVIAEHGRGGLGRVMRARDRELGRSVAIKELLVATKSSELRFFREALITARLEHPGIVPVHEAGRWPDGTPFYAMKLVAGRPLSAVLDNARTPERRRELLPHVIAVADAVAYAHSKGIIHRDLKPANVIVGEFGETVVIDWGLARQVNETDAPDIPAPALQTSIVSPGLTSAGTIIGTPAYMSPEQARGGPVDEGTDIFAIGAMLYHVVSGQPPASLRNAPLPRDIRAIVEKACAPSRGDRYPTVTALAADLRRAHDGAMVTARRYNILQRALHALSRYRRAASFAALGATVVAATMVVATLKVAHQRDLVISGSRALAQSVSDLKVQRDRQLLARARLESLQDPSQSLATLANYTGDEHLAAAEIRLQARQGGIATEILTAAPFNILTASWTSSGHIDFSTADRRVRRYDLGSRQVSAMIDGMSEYGTFASSGDGTRIAYLDSRHRLKVYSATGTYEVATFPSPNALLSMARDGRWLAALASDGTLRICALENAAATCRIIPHIEMAAISWSGRTVALCRESGEGKLVDTASLVETASWRCPVSFFNSITPARNDAFVVGLDRKLLYLSREARPTELVPQFNSSVRFVSVDGDMVAGADLSGQVRVWMLSTGKVVHSLSVSGDAERSSVSAMALDSASSSIALAQETGEVRLRSLVSRLDQRLLGHRRAPHRLAFSGDGRLLSVSIDAMRIWNMQPLAATTLAMESDAFFHVDYVRPDLVASETRRGRLELVNTSGAERSTYDLGTGGGFGLAVSESGKIAVAGRDGSISVMISSNNIRRLPGHEGIVRHLQFLDADRILSCGADGTVRLWTVSDSSHKVLAEHQDECYRIAISPDRARWAAATYDGYVIRATSFSGEVTRDKISSTRVNSLVYIDGETIAAATNDGHVALIFAHGPLRTMMHRNSAAMVVDYHAQLGIVSAFDDGAVVATHANGLAIQQIFAPIQSTPRALAISPSRGLVAVSYANGTVRVCRTADLAISAVLGHTDIVSGLAFSPDSRNVATAGQDGRLLVVPIDSLLFEPSAGSSTSRTPLFLNLISLARK